MSDDIDLQLGRRLRRRRRLLGLTQGELGRLCGVRFQQIQKYESAANRMSASLLARLSKVLGVEAGYFYEGLTGVSQVVPSARVVRSGAGARGEQPSQAARRTTAKAPPARRAV